MNTSNLTIAERIKAVRGDETLACLSKYINCNINTLRSYERGLSNPNFEFIQLLCDVKKISPEWLIFGRDPMHPGDTPQPTGTQAQTLETPPEPTGQCPRCAKMEAKVDRVELQRDELAQENRKLLRENGDLKARCATLEERQKTCCTDPLLRTLAPSALSNEERART